MQSRPEEGLHGFPDGGGDVHTSAASAGANEVYLTKKKIRPACKISSAATRTVVMDAVHESHELQELHGLKAGLPDRLHDLGPRAPSPSRAHATLGQSAAIGE